MPDLRVESPSDIAAMARRLVKYSPVDQTIDDENCKWARLESGTEYAKELVETLEIADKLEGDPNVGCEEATSGGSKVSITDDRSMIIHEIPQTINAIEMDSSFTYRTFVRDNLRRVVDVAYESILNLEKGKDVFVIGQPGKARKCHVFLCQPF